MRLNIMFLDTIYVLILFNIGVRFCNSEYISPKLSPYEYIVDNTPKRLKEISEEFFQSSSKEDIIDFFAPVLAKNELCRNQSLMYKHSFQQFEPWALKMWDSSGKLPSGMLDAHFHDLGNYNECLEVPKEGPYEVKYCLVEVKNFFAAPIYQQHAKFNKAKAVLFGSLRIIKANLYLARCVPASCSEKDLENYYTAVISKYNMTVDIGEYSCTASNQNDPFTTIDWATLAFVVITILLVISGTIVHTLSSDVMSKNKGVITSLVLCYSLRLNSYQILTTKYTKTKLSFLSGLRGLSMILIILAHMGICLTSFPKINYLNIVKDFNEPRIAFAIASTFNLAVDVFLIIGGLLISYLQMRNFQLGRKFNFPLYYIRRLFRIVPPYVAQITLFMTLLYRYLGDGPLWKINMGLTRDNCVKNWWTNLLFINNYVHQDEMCIPTNWYLAVDMQLYFIGPLIFIPMMKSGMFRKYGIPLLILFFNLWVSYTSYINEYQAGSMLNVNIRTEDTNQFIYITTQSRISCWLLGLYLGYILFKVDDDPKNRKISKAALWVGWSLTALVQLLSVLSLYYLMSTLYHNNLFDAFYNGFHRTIFAASICWLIYACELGYGGFIYEVLTWYPLQVIGRLTFTAYLSQMLILMGVDSMTSTTLQYQPIMEFRNAISNITVCFVQSFFLSVLFELPYSNMAKLLSAGVNKDDGMAKEEVRSMDTNNTTPDPEKNC